LLCICLCHLIGQVCHNQPRKISNQSWSKKYAGTSELKHSC
jgi:hypothetical protein